MIDPSQSADEPDEPVADATLDRAISNLRAMRTPPLPADLFATVPIAVDAAPMLHRPTHVDGERLMPSRRRSFAIAAGALAVAALFAAGIGVLFDRLGVFDREERQVAQPDHSKPVPPQPGPAQAIPRQETSATLAVAPHPRLETLADRTAELKERVQSLRAHAEATAARRQAERLLSQYARR